MAVPKKSNSHAQIKLKKYKKLNTFFLKNTNNCNFCLKKKLPIFLKKKNINFF